ncbi:MAG: DMT family transporter [Planctomycetota bacterium]
MPPAAQLLITGALFATGGAALKSCVELTPITAACARTGLAAIVLFAVQWSRVRRPSRGALLIALAHATTMLLFALANRETTAARAIFLQSTAPLWLLVLSPLLVREPVRRHELAPAGLVALGLVLLVVGFPAPIESAPNPALGDLLGATCGVTWALTVLGMRSLARDQDSAVVAPAYGCLFATILGAPFADWEAFGHAETQTLGLVLWLGVFQIAIPYLLLGRALARVQAFEATLLLMIEPALSPLFAWLVHGESVTPLTAVGAAAILGASVWRARCQQPVSEAEPADRSP